MFPSHDQVGGINPFGLDNDDIYGAFAALSMGDINMKKNVPFFDIDYPPIDRAQAPLSLSYAGAKQFLQRYGFDFAIRQYKASRKSQQRVVAYEHWARIALCDFIELNNSTIGQIRALFAKHLRK